MTNGNTGSSGVNEWETEKGDSYSADKFYTAATRRSENVGKIRLPDEMIAILQQMVEQRWFPKVKTRQDFIRDACYHRLRYLKDRSGSIPNRIGDALNKIRMAEELADRELRNAAMLGLIQKTDLMVEEDRRSGDFDHAVDVLRDQHTILLGIEDGYWRRRLLKEFSDRFGGFLATQKVDFSA